MQQSAFIIHCSSGNPTLHWYPWLKERLEEDGLRVFVPTFPIGAKQTLQNWLDTLTPLAEFLEGSVIIGHSLGVPFILDVLNEWNYHIKGAFLVAGFVGKLESDHGEPNVPDFAERNFNWKKVRAACAHFSVIHSDNDNLVPLSKAQELASYLKVELTIIKGAGHFQAQCGYVRFDLLYEKIRLLDGYKNHPTP